MPERMDDVRKDALKRDSFSMEHESRLRFGRDAAEASDGFELPSVKRRKAMVREMQSRRIRESADEVKSEKTAEAIGRPKFNFLDGQKPKTKGTELVAKAEPTGEKPAGRTSGVVRYAAAGAETALSSDSIGKEGKIQSGPYRLRMENENGILAKSAEASAHQLQKKEIQRSYHSKTGRVSAAASGKRAEMERKAARKARAEAEDKTRKVLAFIRRHPALAIALAGTLFLVVMTASLVSEGLVLFSGGGLALSASGFTAEDEQIQTAEQNYLRMEQNLEESLSYRKEQYLENGINNIPVTDVEILIEPNIRHDAYELAALLTTLHGSFKAEDVQDTLLEVFDYQYERQMDVVYTTREVETEDSTEVERRAKITLTVINHGIRYAADEIGLDEQQSEMFETLLASHGNRDDLFDGYAHSDYEVPARYLTDQRFAAIYAEAKKYLDTPYVWGGSSPSGFDCSGYVCYVFNNAGIGLSFARTNCNGLLAMCTAVSAAQAKPGDLVFFQGTQDKAGATHVGIYLGDQMMIHCANPAVRYASLDDPYMQEHFLTFGRMP